MKHEQKLKQSAIVVQAGEGKEDRLARGSFRQLRLQEAKSRAAELQQERETSDDEYFVPGIGDESSDPFGAEGASDSADPGTTSPQRESPIQDDDDPFGLGEP